MGRTSDVHKILGPLEAEIMDLLWAHRAPVTVRQVLDDVNRDRTPPLAYTTVMTVLSRLADKEIVTREMNGRGYRYRSAIDNAAAIAVREVMRDFGDAAIAGFVDQARADPKLLRRLQKLLGDHR